MHQLVQPDQVRLVGDWVRIDEANSVGGERMRVGWVVRLVRGKGG